jgi:hypothetical protein
MCGRRSPLVINKTFAMQIDPESLEFISRTPPPVDTRPGPPGTHGVFYSTWKSAHAKIDELRAKLGITEPEKLGFNLTRLNTRILELELQEMRRGAGSNVAAKPSNLPQATQKSAMEMSLAEIRAEFSRLEDELSIPHVAVSENLTIARSQLIGLQSQKLLASMPRVATVPAVQIPAAAPIVQAVTPELFGRARASAAVKVFGADKQPKAIDPGLKGRARTRAAMEIEGVTASE